ncbi:MAG: hypothetical protein WD069_13235 [Planctomycetales bacterium]
MENVVVIPVVVAKDSPRLGVADVELRPRTLKDLGLVEADVEEFVRKNVQVLFPDDDETLLIVGQQARNAAGGRADLVAVDSAGAIVLIELKRDATDMNARKEPFEFQAIRYAANYALIQTPEKLVELLFAPYIERHRAEFAIKELTSHELATRTLGDFLDKNNAKPTFNGWQRIILIASDFDPQTLSACAWLATNKIDIRCLRVQPCELSGHVLLLVEQVIPPARIQEYFVPVADASGTPKAPTGTGTATRQALPKMGQLLDWGLLSAGDLVYIRGHDDKPATILDAKRVQIDGRDVNFNEWGRSVTGWSAINIYEWAIQTKTGKTLDTLRREKIEELERGNGAAPEAKIGLTNG